MPPQPATIEPLYKEHLDDECDLILSYIGTTNNKYRLQWPCIDSMDKFILYFYKVWYIVLKKCQPDIYT
jgi:hypothetical protein